MRALFIHWWWIPGLLMSALWGFRAVAIAKSDQHPDWESFNNFTSNFVGSIAGWFCLYAIAVRAGAAPDLHALNSMDALLFVVALFSQTGHLVEVMVGLMDALKVVANAVSKRIAG